MTTCPLGIGTMSGYNNRGCRCPDCTADATRYNREYMRTHPLQREKHRRYTAKYRRSLGMRPASQLAAERAARNDRIRRLRADGMTQAAIAALVGVNRRTVIRVLQEAD